MCYLLGAALLVRPSAHSPAPYHVMVGDEKTEKKRREAARRRIEGVKVGGAQYQRERRANIKEAEAEKKRCEAARQRIERFDALRTSGSHSIYYENQRRRKAANELLALAGIYYDNQRRREAANELLALAGSAAPVPMVPAPSVNTAQSPTVVSAGSDTAKRITASHPVVSSRADKKTLRRGLITFSFDLIVNVTSRGSWKLSRGQQEFHRRFWG